MQMYESLTETTNEFGYAFDVNNPAAMTFTPETTHIIQRVKLYLSRYDDGDGTDGTISLKITTTSGLNPVNSNVLTGGSIAVFDIANAENVYSWKTFDLSPSVKLTAGTTYAIVLYSDIYTTWGTPDVKWTIWRRADFANYYDDGWTRGGVGIWPDTTWPEGSFQDVLFSEWGISVVNEGVWPPARGEVSVEGVYDPDTSWDGSDWATDPDMLLRWGGYTTQIIAVGHNKVFFSGV